MSTLLTIYIASVIGSIFVFRVGNRECQKEGSEERAPFIFSFIPIFNIAFSLIVLGVLLWDYLETNFETPEFIEKFYRWFICRD